MILFVLMKSNYKTGTFQKFRSVNKNTELNDPIYTVSIQFERYYFLFQDIAMNFIAGIKAWIIWVEILYFEIQWIFCIYYPLIR